MSCEELNQEKTSRSYLYSLSFIIQLVSTVSTNVELYLEKSVYPTPKATLLLQKKPRPQSTLNKKLQNVTNEEI
uniref:Uncharacterized protein n=1 Tax=Schistosoma haematobium TaxID=6185 RepID=A0A094ZYB2_SCHHA